MRACVVVVVASGCWTGTPPPAAVDARPAAPSACTVTGTGVNADAHVSASRGGVPYLVGFAADKAMVQIARGVDGRGALPIELRRARMSVHGFVRAGEVDLYLRAPRIIGEIFVVGSSQRLGLARGDGHGAEVTIGLPAAVHLVDPARARPWVKCGDLSAFVASDVDVGETLGIRTEHEPHAFAPPTVGIAVTPGGPDVATVDMQDRIAYPIETRGAFTRVWLTIAEADDLAVIGWVPTSSFTAMPPLEHGSGTGWGTIGTMGGPPRLRHCHDEVVVSLVRAGEARRVPVGAIAADTNVEVEDDPDVPRGTVALGRHTRGWLRLAAGARLVIDEAACDPAQNRRPSSGP